MITEHTTLGFGSGAVSALAIVWFVMWTLERAADQNRSIWPGVLFTTALGAGIIALHWHAATAWIDWASASEASTAFVTSTLGVLIGGLFAILLLEPNSSGQENPPYVAVRQVDDGGGSGGAGGAATGDASSPPSTSGAQVDTGIDPDNLNDDLVESLVDDVAEDETPFTRSDEPRPSPTGEEGSD